MAVCQIYAMHVSISTFLDIVSLSVQQEHMRPLTNYVLLAQRLVPHAMVAFHHNAFHVESRNCCCTQGKDYLDI